MERRTGFQIQVSRFEAGGLCKSCRVDVNERKRRERMERTRIA
jgi:hypothetical protein